MALPIALRDAERILTFLDGLETDRHNAIASRNLRLTTIRSFFRMVALREPALVDPASHMVAIPATRTDTTVRDDVTRDEMDAVLASLDRAHSCGRRDYALLLTMYNAGIRDLLAPAAAHHLWTDVLRPVAWEGRKERSIPLRPRPHRS